MNPTELNKLIQQRRAVYAKSYNRTPISQAIIEQVLENARWAPTHRLTEPWRFKVLRGAALQNFANFLIKDYLNTTPVEKQTEMGRIKLPNNVLCADTVILVCMQRDPENRVPEWEEIATIGAAVQNMWLTCAAYGIGAYWGTPGVMQRVGAFCDLSEGERCLGFFFMGNTDAPLIMGKRSPIQDKTVWL